MVIKPLSFPKTVALPRADGPTSSLVKLAGFALTIAFVAVLWAVYAHIAWTVPINSDHSSILLEADDVVRGNLLLHGWTLTAVTFYTTDLPFYVLAVKLRGFAPSLLRDVPALIYALTVAAAVALAGRGLVPERRRLGSLTAFVLIGLPALLVPQIVLVGVNHVATTLFMVLSLLALDQAEKCRLRPFYLTLFGLLLALTVIGDSLAAVVLTTPLLLVSVARIWKDRSCLQSEQQVLIPILAAYPVARGVVALMGLCGGFHVTDPSMKLTYLETLPQNILVTVRSLLSLFRANFFGSEVGVASLGFFLGLLGLGFVLYSFRAGLRLWSRREIGGDRITEVLTAGMLVNLAAYLLDYEVVDYWNTMYSPPERYLVPFFVFSAILAGRYGVALVPNLCRFRLGLGLLGITYTALFTQQLLSPPLDMPEARLATWLERRGLVNGYGNFWSSNIITALSAGHVQVRALAAVGGGLGPMDWFSKRDWYEKAPTHFLVFAPSRYAGRTFYWKGVDEAAARRAFGPPDETDQVGQYIVLVWNKDITPALTLTPEKPHVFH